jgi:hypothetical protein
MAEVVAHPTPNPQAYKFTIEGHTFPSPVTLTDAESAAGTPFAKLFELQGVASIFATANFVTITKAPDAEWSGLLEPARSALAGSF